MTPGAIAFLIIIFPPLAYGMWWMYFRLVPRISAWLLKKMGFPDG